MGEVVDLFPKKPANLMRMWCVGCGEEVSTNPNAAVTPCSKCGMSLRASFPGCTLVAVEGISFK